MYKQTGIIRPIDKLGRVVVPREIRKMLDIENDKDSFEIFMDENNNVVLKKYQPCCIFCKAMYHLVHFGDKLVCCDCIEKLEELRQIHKDDQEFDDEDYL